MKLRSGNDTEFISSAFENGGRRKSSGSRAAYCGKRRKIGCSVFNTNRKRGTITRKRKATQHRKNIMVCMAQHAFKWGRRKRRTICSHSVLLTSDENSPGQLYLAESFVSVTHLSEEQITASKERNMEALTERTRAMCRGYFCPVGIQTNYKESSFIPGNVVEGPDTPQKLNARKRKLEYYSDLVQSATVQTQCVGNFDAETLPTVTCFWSHKETALVSQGPELISAYKEICGNKHIVVDLSTELLSCESCTDGYKAFADLVGENVERASASKDWCPDQYLQNTVTSNETNPETLATKDAILAPVTPEKNIPNEIHRRNALTMYLHERVKHSYDKQTESLLTGLSAAAASKFVCDAEVCDYEGLAPLVDSSSGAFISHSKDDFATVFEEGYDHGTINLNKAPSQKPKRKKHRPKVIKECCPVKKSRVKNQEPNNVQSRTSKGRNSRHKQHLAEAAGLGKDVSEKFHVEKSASAQPVGNAISPAHQDVVGSLEEPSGEATQQIEPDNAEMASELVSKKANLKQAAHGDVFVISKNQVQGITEGLSRRSRPAISGKRKLGRPNLKVLARSKKPSAKKKSMANGGKCNVNALQVFHLNGLIKGKRKKRQGRKLVNGSNNSLLLVPPAVQYKHRLGGANSGTGSNRWRDAVLYCPSSIQLTSNHCSQPISAWNICLYKEHPPDQQLQMIPQDIAYDCQSSNNLHEADTFSFSCQSGVSYKEPLYSIIEQLERLSLDEKHVCSVHKTLEIIPFERKGELVTYAGNHEVVPYEGPFDPSKKKKIRPRVILDAETNRVWNLLMGKGESDDKETAPNEDRERWWDVERQLFKGRVVSFIARMRTVQGDRRFSQWKGSVVDSVIGAFLTQNVSDHLSSSAFISLASRFPLVQKREGATCDAKELEKFVQDQDNFVESASEMVQMTAYYDTSLEVDGQGSRANSGESNPSSEEGILSQSKDLVDSRMREPHWLSLSIGTDGENVCKKHVHDNPFSHAFFSDTMACTDISPDSPPSDHFRLNSKFNYQVGQQGNESESNITYTELLTGISLEAKDRSFRTSSYNGTFGQSALFPDGEEAIMDEFRTRTITCSQFMPLDAFDSHSISRQSEFLGGSTAVGNVYSQNSGARHADNTSELSTFPINQTLPTLTAASAETQPAENEIGNVVLCSNMSSEVLEHTQEAQPQPNNGLGTGIIQLGDAEGDILSALSQDINICRLFSVGSLNQNSGLQPESTHVPYSQLDMSSEIGSEAVEDSTHHFFEKNFQEEYHPCSVSGIQGSLLTDDSLNAASALCSLSQEGNIISHPNNLNQSNNQVLEDLKLALSSTPEDAHIPDNSGLKVPRDCLKTGKFSSRKGSVSRITGVARANIEMSQGSSKSTFDWESVRRKVIEDYSCGVKRERDPNTHDSVNWDAIRSAELEVIADTIRERGMNNILAGRIKAFLERLHTEHGNIDLEWLKDIPPDDAKDFLLSIRGLGLKSVECVRLLALQHLAFPVDTNVGRICVRLGWVPLEPLPESLQLHLLEMYPVLESIQKYLWPRLCTLDQRTLYELHYQMITFGKVFCTKSRPNCNACPMRVDCKHFASAFASARLALPAPNDNSLSVSVSSLALSHQNLASTELALLPAKQQNNMTNTSKVPPLQLMESNWQTENCEPIIEEPATPEHEYTDSLESVVIESYSIDPEEVPTIDLQSEDLTPEIFSLFDNSIQYSKEIDTWTTSKALVPLPLEAASIPLPKLKNVSRLRTEHQVYEIPDGHQLLSGLDAREADDPCSYLLAIWSPGEMPECVKAPEPCTSSPKFDYTCKQESCTSCMSMTEINGQTIKATILIPCRTAMRGSFPLNGTYFQVNEVFADHETSLHPLQVPRTWIWNWPRRTVYFGTSIPTIFKGLTTEAIQNCFWKGYVCVRGFERKVRAPRPLMARLHFPASKKMKTQTEATAV